MNVAESHGVWVMQETVMDITNAADLAAQVKAAGAAGTALVDYGIAHRGVGYAPPDEHHRVHLRPEPGGAIIDHYVRDMAVRCHAGARVDELARALGAEEQFLPLDADGDLTIGEVIAHDVYGPLRCGFGSVRDMLLGLRYIDGLGRDVEVGGRTVKNVAGLDVTRLMVGSLGQLGMVHEATLRTWAVPQQVTCVEVALDEPSRFAQTLTRLMLTEANPVGLSLHAEHEAGGWRARFTYMGTEAGCAVQVQALRRFLDVGEWGKVRLVAEQCGTLQTDHDRRAEQRRWRRDATVLVKVVVLPARTGRACAELREAMQADVDAGGRLHIDAMPMHGCLFLGGDLDGAAALRLDDAIAHVLAGQAGFRVWHGRPADAGRPIEPFAPEQPDLPMLRRLKKAMDPHNVFNPGRYL